jgi:hypothetical protein
MLRALERHAKGQGVKFHVWCRQALLDQVTREKRKAALEPPSLPRH